ncbi:MAG: hypothetical protein JWN44_5073 [Myxococcales bacterium]|nr:hypothetical protein [Myxococcales bacterium]
MSPATTRRTVRPALFYVLAAFGLVSGAFGAQSAIITGLSMLAPRDAYVHAIAARNEPLKSLIPPAELERWSVREAEARYDRRNAAIPLSGVGLILSCLLFAGCLRAMRGDAWGLSAWSLAASASIPYQLISTALAVATTRDLTTIFSAAPATVMMLVAKLQLEMLGALVLGGLALVYFGTCVLYLRTVGVRRLSGDGRTPPSA